MSGIAMLDPPAILVIDDDYDLRGLYAMLLGSEGYEVVMAASLAEAKAALGRPFALVISDLLLPDGPPPAVLELLTGAGVPVVLCTGALHYLDTFAEQLAGKTVAVLTKPFDIEVVLTLAQQYCPMGERGADSLRGLDPPAPCGRVPPIA